MRPKIQKNKYMRNTSTKNWKNNIGLMKESMKCNENLQKLMKKTKRKSEN